MQTYYPGTDFALDEMPPELRTADSIKLLRPADEVFAADALSSFELKPVTVEHPAENVTAENVRKYQVGLMSRVWDESGDVMADLVVMDADAIRAIDAGKNQVSLGYSADVEWTPDNPDHDGVFRKIRGNHIAIVDRARAGSAYRLLDAARRDSMEEEKKPEAVTADQEVDAMAEMKAALAALGERLAALEAAATPEPVADEKPDEEDKPMADEEIEKRIGDGVRERLAVIDAARRVYPGCPTDGDNTKIRMAVIDHLSGGKVKTDSKNPATVAAVFDALVAMPKTKTNQISDALGSSVTVSDGDKARADYIERLRKGQA